MRRTTECTTILFKLTLNQTLIKNFLFISLVLFIGCSELTADNYELNRELQQIKTEEERLEFLTDSLKKNQKMLGFCGCFSRCMKQIENLQNQK